MYKVFLIEKILDTHNFYLQKKKQPLALQWIILS